MKQPFLLQKNLFLSFKSRSSNLEDSQGSHHDLKKYEKNFKKQTSKEAFPISEEVALQTLEKKELILFGDIHAFSQSSKNIHKVLCFLLEKFSPLVVGVEFLFHDQSDLLDHYLNRLITLEEMFESLEEDNRWPFPLRQYAPILKLANEKKFILIPLNSSGTVEERDNFCVQNISPFLFLEKKKKERAGPFCLIFGEYHITPNKIPKLLSQKKKKADAIDFLCFYQVLDTIFLKKENTHLFYQLSSQEICLQNAPSWLKYHSIYTLYENIDQYSYSYKDKQEVILDILDTPEFIVEFSQYLLKSLPSKILKPSFLEDLSLFNHSKLGIFLKKCQQRPKKEQILYEKFLIGTTPFRINQTTLYYIHQTDFNKVCFLIGIQFFLGIFKIKEKDYWKNSSLLFYEYFFAHLFSKVLNPYRKVDLYLDIEKRLEHLPSKEQKTFHKNLLLFLEDFSTYQKFCYKKHFSTMALYHKVLGPMLAEITFQYSPSAFLSVAQEFIPLSTQTSHLKTLKAVFLLWKKLQEKIIMTKTQKNFW